MAKTSLLLAVTVGAVLAASAPGTAEAQGKGKHYAASSGKAVTVTRTVLERQGYDVVRVERAGPTQVIYYRRGNNGKGKGKGRLEKLVIREVKDRIVFEETPPALLVDIDIKLR